MMKDREESLPLVENIGENCLFWDNQCAHPKAEMQGRVSCEGVVDDICIYLRTRVRPESLTEAQIADLKLNPPAQGVKHYIPASGSGIDSV